MRTVLFAFYGRRPNIELQMPYVRRILAQNPDVEFDVWDLSKTREDHEYIRGLTGDRITVRDRFWDGKWFHFNKVWRHYIRPEYSDCLFVKLDDDVVFLETDTFPTFIRAVDENRDSVVSALTINNGASMPLIPGLRDLFETLGIPLLDVHLSAEFAEMSHRWFFDNWRALINQPAHFAPTEEWLSINCVGFDWEMLRWITARIGKRAPNVVAGRSFNPVRDRIGDEGSANMWPRLIHTGFVCSHLTFGPQDKTMDDGLLTELRKQYCGIASEYL